MGAYVQGDAHSLVIGRLLSVGQLTSGRVIGVDVRALSPQLFASHPLVVLIDGSEYVRSLRNADIVGGLIF
ncbi:hypothetical protein [Peristeroidobacter agariperforans]|uniref:hypothetical protein n=1 Tax=Peristeroidobacter agariperforans TaxID=268404 RepID=UPI0013003F37|nr:hypothetical protein [Peristeroidobacter agariperforans]